MQTHDLFMAIYSRSKKMLQRKIVLQHKCPGCNSWVLEWWLTEEEFKHHHVDPGEDYVMVDMHYYWQGHEICHAAIEDKLYEKHGMFGIMPGDDRGRCAVIDKRTGIVVAIIMADDELFIPPDGYVAINNVDANLGDVWPQFASSP
jgi:hypothetical protein